MRIHVFGDMFGPSWASGEDDERVTKYEAVGIGEFFDRRFTTDAMGVAYTVPGCSSVPRLAPAALATLQNMGAEPLLCWAIFDIDNEDHARWPSQAHAAQALDHAIEQLPPELYEAAGGYTTRAGMRLMWRMDPPLPCSLANSFLHQLGERIAMATGLEVDPVSYEWTRQFRVPRATRDSVLLEPVLNADPLFDGEALSWADLGFDLEVGRVAGFELGGLPDVPEEVSPLLWARVRAPAWLVNGEVIPSEDGHTYPVLRSTLGQLAATGDLVDADVLFAMVYRSVAATPNRRLEDAWKLACWVAAQQTAAMDLRQAQEAQCPSEVTPPSTEEWLRVRERLQLSQSDRRTIERLAAGTRPSRSKDDAVAAFVRAADLLAPPLNNVREVYRYLYTGARDARRLTQEQLWAMCQQAVKRHRTRLKTLEETRAFVDQHPILVAVKNKLYILNTLTEPFSYSEVWKDDFVGGMYQQITAPNLPDTLDIDLNQPMRTVFTEYGVIADDLVYVSGQEGSQLERQGGRLLLKAGVHRLRPCEARYHADVHQWLAALGGDSTEDLLDWLAAVPYTQAPLAMLYLHGPPNIGKSLLISGIASLWADRAANYNAIANSSFNADLLSCPLVAADEGLVVGKWDRFRVSQEFRNMVANTTHTIGAKYANETTLRGSLRVILCANEADALPIEQSLDKEGLDAIVQRILYIRTGDAGGEVIRRLGGRAGVEHWVQHGRPGAVAEHILWLSQTRVLDLTGRFLVEGRPTEWHRRFVHNQGRKPDVIEVLFDLLSDKATDPSVRVASDADEEVVWVHLDSFRRELRNHPIRLSWKAARTELGKLAVCAGRKRIKGAQVRVVGIPWDAFTDTDIAERGDLVRLAASTGPAPAHSTNRQERA